MKGGHFQLAEASPKEPELLMTSMIDVIFILLAVFLCVSELKKGTLSVDVPEVASAEAPTGERADPIVVEVTADDLVYVDSEPAGDAEALERILEARARAVGTEVPIRLNGDKAASNGAMMQVISGLSRAGFKRIEYAVEAGD